MTTGAPPSDPTLGASSGTLLAGPRLAPPADAPLRDEAWFAAVYEESFESVFRYSSVLTRDQHLAEDVTAEAFLRVWRARDKYRGDGALLAWILTITRNCALTALGARKQEVDLALIDEPEDHAAVWDSGDGSSTEALQNALAELTAEQQQVIFLRFFKEMPHDAVALALDRNPAAVRAIQFRALQRMRKLMEASHAR
jgi:RNA polymerase sigma-70 factor (ECF subfamily)